MNVQGTWKLTMDTPIGTQTPAIIITEEDGAYKGAMNGLMGTYDLEEISVDGNRVAFKAEVDSPTRKVSLAFNGTVEGSSISGHYESPSGSIPFAGERQ
ncbi:MAG: hypothetical protein GY777_05585 [Candidatus Brocadiaceae bacterium]|nr:hypothetical protein [Candidatus Brocadiaceae bacterium]